MAGIAEILKKRWPEALLVVGFQSGVFVLRLEIMKMAQAGQAGWTMPEGASFLIGAGTIVFAVITYLLLLGFLSSAWHEGADAKKEPIELLRAGKYYFWRMLRFEILLSVALVGVSVLAMTFAAGLMGIRQQEQVPTWLLTATMFCAFVVLIKPSVLCPAIMIVQDRMVFESAFLLRSYQLGRAKGLLVLVGAGVLSVFGLSVVSDVTEKDFLFLSYIIEGLLAIVSSVLLLVIALGAIWFVGQNTPAQAGTDPKDAGDDEQDSDADHDVGEN